MRKLVILALLGMFSASASAQNPHPLPHPRLPPPPVGLRIEPIPPLGNNLPRSYRARFNRPTYIGGKIAYYLSPTSQEAMSWHEHVHSGAYRNHAGRIEKKFFYAKPWEILTVGPRTPAQLGESGETPIAPYVESGSY